MSTLSWRRDFFATTNDPAPLVAKGATHNYYLHRTDEHPGLYWRADAWRRGVTGPVYETSSLHVGRESAEKWAEQHSELTQDA